MRGVCCCERRDADGRDEAGKAAITPRISFVAVCCSYIGSVPAHTDGSTLAQERDAQHRPEAGNLISAVPQPLAVARMIWARHTCFCGVHRSPTLPPTRPRSPGVPFTPFPPPLPTA